MRTIIFLGVKRSGSTRDAVTAAHQLGLQTVVLTDRLTFMRDQAAFPDIDKMLFVESWCFDDVLQIIESIKTEGMQIECIVSLMDPHVSLATALAEEFGINHQSLHAIETMEDKVETRKALTYTTYNPVYTICHPDDPIPDIVEDMSKYVPVVIKVPDSTGSKDVRRALNQNQFHRRLASIRSRFPSKKLLIEQYLKGPQYLVEVYVDDGDITPVAIIKQHMLNRNGYMVVDGYAVLIDPDEELKNSLLTAVEAIVRKLRMKAGTCHLELRRAENGEWKLIEINPRISGGAMNRMIEIAYGIDYVREILKMMLGETPDLEPKCMRHVYTKFVTSSVSGILKRVNGSRRASRVPGVEEVFINRKQGQRIKRPESMGNRYAYVIAADNHDLDAAERAACLAAAQIQFVLEGGGHP